MSSLTIVLLCVISTAVHSLDEKDFVNIEEYPYHVSIQESGWHICSGAFIHESWIITAASCFIGVDPTTISVRVRTSTISRGGDELEISSVVAHPQFDECVYHNNVALVKLKIPAQYGRKLLPIELPRKKNSLPDDGLIAVVTGWRHNSRDRTETQLAATKVPIVNLTDCIKSMPGYCLLSETVVCAGHMTSGVESCQGDSGAPLMRDQTLIGILSYGLGCKTMIHPGVYTRISSYLPWISANSGITYT